MAIHHARSRLYHIADGRLIMPADRRIIVNVSEPGYRDPALQGEWVPGAVTPIGVWASRRDKSLTDIATEGGTRNQGRRNWRIRWDARIANSTTANLEVVDASLTFTISNMVEVIEQRGGPDLRRRFLDLQGIHG